METSRRICISGVYPHLAVFNDRFTETGVGETGIGAVVPWAGKLWAVTYSAHRPQGSADRLYEIAGDLSMTVRPESVGGTPANRIIHRESNQLIIGPYFIDEKGGVRVIPPSKMYGRLTATARHLTDPANKVYFFTMEEGLYEVDVHTLEVKTIHEDRNKQGVPDLIPGYHGKGGYMSQGRLVVSNNGESAGADPDYKGPSGCLAEWDGTKWNVVERRQFCEVTGPGGIAGAPDGASPLWATGWDERSVILKLLDDGKWHTFRMPKASFTYDGAHGWHTEWPRIREIGNDRMLMTMHGMFWDFPKTFRAVNTSGIRPLSTYLKIIPDFCEWNGRIVFGCDDTSLFSNELVGQPQSNFWFVAPAELGQFGPPVGFGAVWANDTVTSGVPSDPYLFAGFDKRMVHLSHESDAPVTFLFETDARGTGEWKPSGSVRVPGKGYAYRILPADLKAQWIRVKTDQDCPGATASFHYAVRDTRGANPAPPVFQSIPSASNATAFSTGVVRPSEGGQRTLQFLASVVNDTGKEEEIGYYEIDSGMRFRKVDDAKAAAFLKEKVTPREPAFTMDEASVIMKDYRGNRLRLPKGDPVFDTPFAEGWPRCIREVATERSLLNCHGTFYELPRDISGGLSRIKPICTHNRRIRDFCSWRGLMVIAGTRIGAQADGHFFSAKDGKGGLWFGVIDDLWKLGKPRGTGGPWRRTAIKAGEPSDPYLMTGFDKKTLLLSHDSDAAVRFSVEVDFLCDGTWKEYGRFTVSPGSEFRHEFPDGFSAHWVRLKGDKDCLASAIFVYE
jgi:hypothetical protein